MQENISEALTQSSAEKAIAPLGISMPMILAGERPPSETISR
jgi:hypothetical protein